MEYNLSGLIDIDKKQRLLDSFCDAVGIAAAIIDLNGEVLVGSRWQRICTDFHRANKQTCKKCIESDTQLANELQQGKRFSIYQCRNGLTDAASPIIIEDKHVANVFVGQFFLKAPDREFFLRQAATYGFEEIAYLDALSEVPIVTEESLTGILNFLVIFTEMLAIMGLNQLRQTEVKKALQVNEERLRVTNERLELAMDAGEHGFWDWNIDTNEMFFSPRYYTMLGYENEELPMVLETWINLMHSEDRETIVPQIQKYVENAEPYGSEFRLKSKDGSWRWISGRGKSYELDENGVSHRAVGLHVDITERKQMEETLRENEKKYRTLLETTSEGCWLLNLEHKTVEVNTTLCKMLGYNQDEMIGKKPFDFVDDENRKIFIEQTSKISTTEHRSYEIVLKKKNGEDLHTYFNATTIRDKSGEALGSFAFITDITERKKMETQLQQSQKMKTIGTLASGIAHDFNNLLTTILGYAELGLIDLGKDSPQYESLKEIIKAGNSAASLTRQLLAFSRKQIIQPVILDLNIAIEDIEKMLQRMIGEDSELRILPKPDLGKVMADPGQIEQVIMNLAINARDAMPQGGKITIETANVNLDENYFHHHRGASVPGPYVMLSVSDTGKGMDKETQSRIFEPFFTTKEKARERAWACPPYMAS